MDPVDRFLYEKEMLLPLVAIGCGTLIAVISIIFSLVRSMVVSKEKEQTKRELAAYVAEGTLDADKAVAMINAGRPHWETGKGEGKGGCGCA